MIEIKLQKINSRGASQLWTATVDENKIKYEWGQEGGKMQIQYLTVSEGKNIGRSNETKPHEQAILEAEKKARGKVEEGYNIINKYKLTINEKTVLSQVNAPGPMLAHPIDKYWNKIEYPCYVQPKLDGIRALIKNDGSLIASRNGKPIFGMEHILEEIKKLQLPKQTDIEWLDGELYTHGLTFQEITKLTRARKNLAEEEELKQIQFWCFDCVSSRPFIERRNQINTLQGLEFIVPVNTFLCTTREELDRAHIDIITKGYEGSIIRTGNKPYENKRSYSLFKRKDFEQEEFEVIGFEQEKGKDSLGACTCITKTGQKFNTRPAMTHEDKKEIWEHQDKYMGQIATVKYQNLTDDGIPRFPVIIGFRHPNDM